MGLQYQVEDISEVDESLHDQYEETEDGVYRLAVDGVVPEEELNQRIEKIDAKKREILDEKKQLQKQFEGVDLEEWREYQESKKEINRKRAEESGDWDEREKQIREEYSGEIDQLETAREALTRKLRETLVTAKLREKIVEHGGRPEFLLPHMEGRVEFELDDESFEPDYTILKKDGSGPLRGRKGELGTFDDLVLEFKAHDVFGDAFAGSGRSGSGAERSKSRKKTPVDGGNPWSKKTWNVTRQMQIARDNPALAEELKAEVGG